MPLKGSIPGKAWSTFDSLVIPDLSKHYPNDLDPDYLSVVRERIGSIIAWPIRFERQVVAVLTIEFPTANAFYEEAEPIAHAIASAFETAFSLGVVSVPQHGAKARRGGGGRRRSR